MTIPSAQTVYTQASGSTSTKPFLKYFSTRAPTPNDINNWQVGQSWIVPGTSLTASITGATQADPCVITAINGFSVGQLVTITSVGGMTELNGNQYQITDADGISFTINTDSTSFTAYTTGGIATVAVEYEYILAGLTSSNGRVSANWVLLGGGSSGGSGSGGIDTLTGDSGGAVPGDATGNLNILGTAGQITVTGSPGANTLTLALAGGGTAIDSFQPDSGTNPVVPTGTGLVTMAGSGSITTVGGANTLTTQLTGLTNHSVLVGAGTTTITKVAPSATSGVPLISQGAAADPVFGTAAIAGGGTNATSFSTTNGIVKYDGTSLVSSTAATLSSANIYTNTAQPAFLVSLTTSTAGSDTGDGTVYHLGNGNSGVCTTIFDQAGNITFPGNICTFTAPVDGIYFFYAKFLLNTLADTHTGSGVSIVTTGSQLNGGSFNPGIVRDGANDLGLLQCSGMAQMSAGNTATCQVVIGTSTKTVGVSGNAANSPETYFMGYKIA